MPLREDLLVPIEGENPSGNDLRYDKVFDQIKEARIEDDDSLPSGDWGRSPKKADRVLVIKLAGDALAKRAKDLRLTAWYLESLVRREGFGQLAGGIALLHQLQDVFWDTVHPEREDDGNMDLRIAAVETASLLLATSLQVIPLTRTGFNWIQYQDAKAVGMEVPDMSEERSAARSEAISQGRATGEDLQRAIDSTPKAFYVDLEGKLVKSLEALDLLAEFQQDKYGDDYPSLGKLKSSIEEIKKIAGSVLAEKRKTEPDAVVEEEETPPEEELPAAVAEEDEPEPADEPERAPVAARAVAAPKRKAVTGLPTDEQSAYEQIAAAAEFLRTLNSESAVPYLVSSALRFGQTRTADMSDYSFAVAPPTETRQVLRRLANDGSWDELMQQCLRAMAEPCGRVWLDVQRYAWRSARETSNDGLAAAIVATVRGLLSDVPDLRGMVMDDDTPAANTETQQWIDAEILLPPLKPEVVYRDREPEPVQQPEPIYIPQTSVEQNGPPDIYATALQVLERGRVAEAINMLVRDSEQQPSGRMRFQRRVQMAQLCLAANQPAVAYPVLRDLSSEVEKRALETWEAADMLSVPLSLLLQCLDKRGASEQEREIVFERLCRLDPQAALMVGL